MIETLAPDLVQLVGNAAFPIVEALDRAVPPREVATRARPALERLAISPEVPLEVCAAARSGLSAAISVQHHVPASYASLLRAVSRLLLLADLPVPAELAESVPRTLDRYAG
jgi:hypothetical protein